METYTAETYGERIAGRYDEWFGKLHPATVPCLAELAGGKPALELGIGTGRVALPLQAAGVEVHGIDASNAMLAQLRAKPGGEQIPVTVGNFSAVNVDGQFGLVYVLFNTFFALLTQAEQVGCFRNVTAHLAPQGVFLIEAFVPDMTRFSGGQALRVTSLDEAELRLDATRHDPVTQQLTSHHVVLSAGGVELYPVRIRYVWPTEMDLMAQLAGLELKQRWGDWNRGEFTAASSQHISVYGFTG